MYPDQCSSHRSSQRHDQGRLQRGEPGTRKVIHYMGRGPNTMSPTCEHAERRCTRRSRMGLCCTCADSRSIKTDGRYKLCVDGQGWVYNAPRWAAYCESCREVESTGCEPVGTGMCEHWATRGCLMPMGLGLCCSCLNGRHPVYVDGQGWVYEETPLAAAFYCQICKGVEEVDAVNAVNAANAANAAEAAEAAEAKQTEDRVEMAKEAITSERDVREDTKQEAVHEDEEVVGRKEEEEVSEKWSESERKMDKDKDDAKEKEGEVEEDEEDEEEKEEEEEERGEEDEEKKEEENGEDRDELKTYVKNLAQQIAERPNSPTDQADEPETMSGFEVVALLDIDVELSLPAAQPKKGGGWLG